MDIVYHINYGYIKEIITAGGEYQVVNVLGKNKDVNYCKDIVYAIVEIEYDVEDK